MEKRKMNEIRSSFFENIKEIDKLLAMLPKKNFEDSEMIEGPLLKLQK